MSIEQSGEDRETSTEVKVYRVRLTCGRCNGGDLRVVKAGEPLHRCSHCGVQKEIEGEGYPRNKYLPVGSR